MKIARLTPASLVLVSLAVALPAIAAAAPRDLTAAATPAPEIVKVTPPGVTDAPETPEVSDEMRAYLEHKDALVKSRLGYNGDVGGVMAIGVQLGRSPMRPQDGSELDPAVLAAFRALDGFGAPITVVIPDSPAADAGLRAGDVVVQIAGLWVDSELTLRRLVSRAQQGEEYELRYVRGGDIHTTWVMPITRSELALLQPAPPVR